MGAIDIKSLLALVMPDNPCGDDLRADSRYFELEAVARGRPARLEGQNEIPAEEPNWAQVRTLAEDLLAQSKDLRVVMHLIRALVRVDGYVGLEAGLAVLRNLIEDHWSHVHPRLDPEDNSDPTERLNILAELIDSQNLLRFVRFAPLVSSRELGRFSLRDHEIASGKQSVPTNSPPISLATIEACFQASALDAIQSTQGVVRESLGHLHGIADALKGHLTSEQVPDCGTLVNNLKNAEKILEAALKKRGVVSPDSGVEVVAGKPGQSGVNGGPINSREDCVRVLDLVIEYFKERERSSPLPLLLERAKKLMSKDFMEIMQDLAPDGVAQANKVFGTDAKKN